MAKFKHIRPVKAINSIKLYKCTIPSETKGFEIEYTKKLRHLKTTESFCVIFPSHMKKPFVAAKEEIQDA